MRSGVRLLALLLGAVMFASAQTGGPFVPAQVDGLVRRPAAGRYLVSKQNLRDPNFFQTVILLVSYSEKEAMGLVVNRPT
ncbi:MAG: YqgE/AlgH family protein, partial [bacterium]|nr:YqgE/AlgH family protein [bacterium]